MSGWTWGNGATHSRDFDLDGRLISQDFGSVTRTLAYDAAGRITSLTHSSSALQNRSFNYDALDRLTGYSTSTASQTYGYDATGNRTSLTNTTNTYAYTYPPGSNRLSSVAGPIPKTFTYDAAGDLAAETGRSYAYDGQRRLTQVTYSAGSNSYLINGLGQRLLKSGTGTGVATRFL